jgi:hypothetical protein
LQEPTKTRAIRKIDACIFASFQSSLAQKGGNAAVRRRDVGLPMIDLII